MYIYTHHHHNWPFQNSAVTSTATFFSGNSRSCTDVRRLLYYLINDTKSSRRTWPRLRGQSVRKAKYEATKEEEERSAELCRRLRARLGSPEHRGAHGALLSTHVDAAAHLLEIVECI